MKVFTAHVREDRAPVLMREGFAWSAAIYGPLWLAGHRAWVPAALVLAGEVSAGFLVPDAYVGFVFLAWRWLFGFLGPDLRRWALEARGYTLAHVVAAPDVDAAFARLLTARPDLADDEIPALRAP